MELLFGIFSYIVIDVSVRLYVRYLATDVARDAAFERWCSGRPLVLALFCPNGGAREMVAEIESLVARGGYVNNYQGRHPWPHYLFRLHASALGDRVVGVFVERCRIRRGPRRHPDLADVVRALIGRRAGDVDKLWLHLALHTDEGPNAAPGHGTEGWHGRLDSAGALHLVRDTNRPLWLLPSMLRGL